MLTELLLSPQVEFDEFIDLICKYSTSKQEDIDNTWQELDVDGDGCITSDELKDVLAKVGIR